MAMGCDRSAGNVLFGWEISHFQDVLDSSRPVNGRQGVRLGLLVMEKRFRGVEIGEGEFGAEQYKK